MQHTHTPGFINLPRSLHFLLNVPIVANGVRWDPLSTVCAKVGRVQRQLQTYESSHQGPNLQWLGDSRFDTLC